jgi:hypothetical protein
MPQASCEPRTKLNLSCGSECRNHSGSYDLRQHFGGRALDSRRGDRLSQARGYAQDTAGPEALPISFRMESEHNACVATPTTNQDAATPKRSNADPDPANGQQ